MLLFRHGRFIPLRQRRRRIRTPALKGKPRSRQEPPRVNDVQPITPSNHPWAANRLRSSRFSLSSDDGSKGIRYSGLACTRLHRLRDAVSDQRSSRRRRPAVRTFRGFCRRRARIRTGLPQAHLPRCRNHLDQRVRLGGSATADTGSSCPPARRSCESGGRRLRDRHWSPDTHVACAPKSSAPANLFIGWSPRSFIRAVSMVATRSERSSSEVAVDEQIPLAGTSMSRRLAS